MDETLEMENLDMPHKKREKYEQLCKAIRKKKKLMIALSGGIDSSLVASIALQELGKKNTLAVTIDSALLPRRERDMAHRTAQTLGMHHIIKKINLLTPAICQNTPLRCYHCKKRMADVLWNLAHEKHMDTIADGITRDDLANSSYVGVKAWTEAGIWHPLAQYGFTQREIHSLAHEQGLETWNKPPEACLATRLEPYEIINPKKLEMIEEAEDFLKPHVSQVRVRMHHDLARIEVPLGDIETLVTMKKKITRKLRTIGFRYVTLDLDGYKMGSMSIPSSQKNF